MLVTRLFGSMFGYMFRLHVMHVTGRRLPYMEEVPCNSRAAGQQHRAVLPLRVFRAMRRKKRRKRRRKFAQTFEAASFYCFRSTATKDASFEKLQELQHIFGGPQGRRISSLIFLSSIFSNATSNK